jgi:hypothetical protein
MNLPVKHKPRLNYGLILPIVLIPLVLWAANEIDKGLFDKETPAKSLEILTPAIKLQDAIPVPTPTPIVIKELKTVVKVVNYQKVYVKYTKWHCDSGKCSRRVKVYGRLARSAT